MRLRGAARRTELTMPANPLCSFGPVPPQRALPYFGFHSRANHVSRETMAGIV